MSERCCLNCPHWQGCRTSEYGACYRVIETLIDCEAIINRFGWELSVPFDPHDVKYLYSEARKEFHQKIKKLKEEGVKIQTVKEKDVVYDDEGGERIAPVTLYYIQTHRNYTCKEE